MEEVANNEIMMRVLIFREGDSLVAQCLEYDLCASASTLEDLEFEFTRTAIGHISICKAEGLEPFKSLSPAPEVYWDAFNGSWKVEIEKLRLTDRAIDAPHPPQFEARVFPGKSIFQHHNQVYSA